MGSRMSLSVVGLNHMPSKESKDAMPIGDMVTTRSMIHVQQVEQDQLKEKEEFKNNKAKT